jgi:hypothetical protein
MFSCQRGSAYRPGNLGLGLIVEVQECDLHRSYSKSFTRPPGESTHRRLRNNAVSTKCR